MQKLKLTETFSVAEQDGIEPNLLSQNSVLIIKAIPLHYPLQICRLSGCHDFNMLLTIVLPRLAHILRRWSTCLPHAILINRRKYHYLVNWHEPMLLKILQNRFYSVFMLIHHCAHMAFKLQYLNILNNHLIFCHNVKLTNITLWRPILCPPNLALCAFFYLCHHTPFIGILTCFAFNKSVFALGGILYFMIDFPHFNIICLHHSISFSCVLKLTIPPELSPCSHS